MSKKITSINYTSRDFDSIRQDLETFTKRYYADTYKDFNETSFGALMLDTVSYVGDMLSFYLDYQTNESFLQTAIEYKNVVKIARQLGYKLDRSPSSFGALTFYIEIPAESATAAPDLNYAPILRQGSTFSATGGAQYTLLEDIDFGFSSNQIVVGTVDETTGAPLSYVIRGQGSAVSGLVMFQEVEIGGFQKFRRVNLNRTNVAEILSVHDSEGHEYIEVEHLSQNTVYKAIRNTDTATNDTVTNIIKAVPVARRFVVENDGTATYLQFGYGSDSELLTEAVPDPSSVIMNLNGRNYITDEDFDPTKLISTDKFGIAPANTMLRIGMRVNTVRGVNAAVNTIVNITRPIWKFPEQGTLSRPIRNNTINTLEVTNESPFVGDIALPSSREVKERVYGHYASQNRAVTLQDYRAVCYAMPAKFGAIKRAAIIRDFDEFRRNLNIYVISEDTSHKLIQANATIKHNLRNWLLQHKMVNDTIDILDATIINFGIRYEIVSDMNSSRYTILSRAAAALSRFILHNQYEIGESILITDFYKVLNKVDGVVDVVDLEIMNKMGVGYSNVSYDMDAKLSADGRRMVAEKNSIFELKFPNVDIKGSVR